MIQNTGAKLVLSFDSPELKGLISRIRLEAPKELNKALRKAATKAGSILLQAVRQKIPKNKGKALPIPGGTGKALVAGKTGLLKRSMTKVIRTMKRTGKTVLIVGPDTKKELQAYSPWLKRMITVRASRYAHLVELGFTQKMRGRTKRIPAKPFFRPALDETRSKIIGTVIDSLREALEKIMTKLAMKSAAGRVAA